jgi:hypothetical protein
MIILIIKSILLAGSAILWRCGGSDKFPLSWRRFGVPVLMGISAIITQNWLGLISLPLLALSFALGYGVNSSLVKFWSKKLNKLHTSTQVKMFARATCGLAYSMASIFFLWGNWWAYIYHILLVASYVCITGGGQKFKYSAVLEEGGIGVIVAFMPIWG